ncbi:MAG: MFS transporter [Pseudomonadota bacterium]
MESVLDDNRLPPAYLSWLVWGLGAIFYLTGFYHRVAPAVMTDQLMAEFNIGAAALGNFSAFYFYSYVAMQIPTGILADRWGPRKLLITGSLVATLGTFIFGLAPTILLANLGRLLIGGAAGIAYVTVLRIQIQWLPAKRFAMASGLTFLCGVAGAVSAGVPLRILLNHFGWRPVILISAAATLAIAVAIWRIVSSDPADKGYASYAPPIGKGLDSSLKNPMAGLKTVLRYRNTWLLALAPSGLTGSVLTFSGLWGVPFLTTHYGLSPTKSAAIASTLLVTWAIGGIVLGMLSDKLERRKAPYFTGGLVAVLGWTLAIYIPGWPIWVLVTLLIIVGFSSGAIMIGLSFVKESVPTQLAGTALGVCNMGVMVGPMILPPAIGLMLDRYWQGVMTNGVRIYDLAAYRAGFGLIIAWCVISVVLVSFTKETRARQLKQGT